jgi:hypothetical protein
MPVSLEKTLTARRQRFYHRRKCKLVEGHGGACLICGYDRSVDALGFHHLDPKKKKFSISGKAMYRNFKELWAESLKCVLLCNRCHAETEAQMHSRTKLEDLRRKILYPSW